MMIEKLIRKLSNLLMIFKEILLRELASLSL